MGRRGNLLVKAEAFIQLHSTGQIWPGDSHGPIGPRNDRLCVSYTPKPALTVLKISSAFAPYSESIFRQ